MSGKINLGYEVMDFEQGIMVENVPLKQFKYNMLISGRDSCDRSAVLSHILNQIYVKAPHIGVLLVKLSSNKGACSYNLDKVYEYGDLELEIPYFLEHRFNDVDREHLINCINAVFGFHFEVKWVMRNVVHHYKLGRFPSSLIDFLEDVKNYLIEHPYDKEFNDSNIGSIEKAIELVQEDSILERTIWIPSNLPEWLELWCEGKKVCIDLSSCDPHYKKILVAFLFQNLINFLPHGEADIPSGIVVLEDADHVFKEPPHEYYRNTYNEHRSYYEQCREKCYILTKEQIEEAYGDSNYLLNVQFENVIRNYILDEFRYRSISLINVCENTEKIYKSINSHSRIRVQLKKKNKR